MPAGLYLLHRSCFEDIYGPEERAAIARSVVMREALLRPEEYKASDEIFPDVEIILSGWGMVPMDERFFTRFPKIRAVLYGAGSVKGFVTPLTWKHGVRVTSAYAANAIPVAEFAVSQIHCALKQSWQNALYIRRNHRFPEKRPRPPGAFRTTVGLISLGMIGRMVAERLKAFDLRVVAHDPFVSREEAAHLGVGLCSVEQLFAVSDVVSCHTPLLAETEGILRGQHFASMKANATFLNTSRGRVVHEPEMIEVLRTRPDLFAILDVTAAEPPAPDSPLYTMENVILTPHIAGSMAMECRRMGGYTVEELGRLLRGEPLRYEMTEAKIATMA
jgi:phosphoglycerate dehydrogenase-like enzyme